MSLSYYLIQINIYLILFYLFYQLVLKNEPFFILNRTYLMGTSLIALLIPLFQIDWFKTLPVTEQVEITAQTIAVHAEPIILTPVTPSGLTYTDYLTFIYFTGVALFTLRFLFLLIAVYYQKNEIAVAWSFFNRIVVSADLPARDTILTQEKVHASQMHSADRVFMEMQ